MMPSHGNASDRLRALLASTPPHEAAGSLRFANRWKLREHVVKHLIDGHDERWHQVVDADVLSAARDEYAMERPSGRGWFGPSCSDLAKQYLAVLSQTLIRACRESIDHVHMLDIEWDPDFTPSAGAQGITAWSGNDRLRIIARNSVSDSVSGGGPGPYVIRTGFRPWPRLSASAFRRRQLAQSRERARTNGESILAIHAGTTGSTGSRSEP